MKIAVQAGVRRRERDPLAIEGSVRLIRVDVKRATQRLPGASAADVVGRGRGGAETKTRTAAVKAAVRYEHDQ